MTGHRSFIDPRPTIRTTVHHEHLAQVMRRREELDQVRILRTLDR
jgi:hypothetical protein